MRPATARPCYNALARSVLFISWHRHLSAGREGAIMPRTARKKTRKYGKKAQSTVASAMRRKKRGTLRSGRSGRKVTSRKQAIAIGLSEARKKGAKVPPRRSASR